VCNFLTFLAPYFIPNATVRASQEIKRSRFITQLAHTPGITCAKAFIQHIKDEHPGAGHHCWGFVAGAPGDTMQLGFSDDGEPSGTAGKPILAHLQGSEIGEISAVVTRYSGGIKLGTGGLVKAYGGGVRLALAQLIPVKKTPSKTLNVNYLYPQQNAIDELFRQFEVTVLHSLFTATVSLTVTINAINVHEFINMAKIISDEQIKITVSTDI
jgi:uncharacterized YigZ family protein